MLAVDWSQLDQVGFEAAMNAARLTARSHPQVDEDDVFQEACIYVATHGPEMDKQRAYGEGLPGERGGLWGAVRMVSKQLTLRMREWANRQVNADGRELLAAIEVEDEQPAEVVAYPRELFDLPYSPPLIESLLPLLWEPSLASEPLVAERVEGMPKAQSNPAHSGTHMAHAADIRTAWERAGLSFQVRAALFARFGLGLTLRDAAALLKTGKEAQRLRVQAGVVQISDFLNGVKHD